MKNLSIRPLAVRLFLVFFLAVFFAFSLQIDLPAATGGPVPGSKEISGTHVGSKSKDMVPWNMVRIPAGKTIMGMDGKMAIELSEGQPLAFNSFSRCHRSVTSRIRAAVPKGSPALSVNKTMVNSIEMRLSSFLIDGTASNSEPYLVTPVAITLR